MAAIERIINLILQWKEVNARLPEDLATRLNLLMKTTGKLSEGIGTTEKAILRAFATAVPLAQSKLEDWQKSLQIQGQRLPDASREIIINRLVIEELATALEDAGILTGTLSENTKKVTSAFGTTAEGLKETTRLFDTWQILLRRQPEILNAVRDAYEKQTGTMAEAGGEIKEQTKKVDEAAYGINRWGMTLEDLPDPLVNVINKLALFYTTSAKSARQIDKFGFTVEEQTKKTKEFASQTLGLAERANAVYFNFRDLPVILGAVGDKYVDLTKIEPYIAKAAVANMQYATEALNSQKLALDGDAEAKKKAAEFTEKYKKSIEPLPLFIAKVIAGLEEFPTVPEVLIPPPISKKDLDIIAVTPTLLEKLGDRFAGSAEDAARMTQRIRNLGKSFGITQDVAKKYVEQIEATRDAFTGAKPAIEKVAESEEDIGERTSSLEEKFGKVVDRLLETEGARKVISKLIPSIDLAGIKVSEDAKSFSKAVKATQYFGERGAKAIYELVIASWEARKAAQSIAESMFENRGAVDSATAGMIENLRATVSSKEAAKLFTRALLEELRLEEKRKEAEREAGAILSEGEVLSKKAAEATKYFGEEGAEAIFKLVLSQWTARKTAEDLVNRMLANKGAIDSTTLSMIDNLRTTIASKDASKLFTKALLEELKLEEQREEEAKRIGTTLSEGDVLLKKATAATKYFGVEGAEAIYKLVSAQAPAEKNIRAIVQNMVAAKGTIDSATSSMIDSVRATISSKEAAKLFTQALEEELGLTKKSTKVNRSVQKVLDKTSGYMSRLGMRLSWFGYRLTMMGRILMGWFIKPIEMAISSLTDWEKSIETTVTAMGFLEATGNMTAKRFEILEKTLRILPERGIEMTAAWSYLQSTLITLLSAAGYPLIKLFYALGDAIASLVPFIETFLVPAIQSIVGEVIGLIPGFLVVAKTAIPAFVLGLQTGIPVLFSFIDALRPLIPTLAALLGFVAPFTPILVLLGTSLYFVSAALTGLSGIITFLLHILPTFITTIRKNVINFLTLDLSATATGKAFTFLTGITKLLTLENIKAIPATLALSLTQLKTSITTLHLSKNFMILLGIIGIFALSIIGLIKSFKKMMDSMKKTQLASVDLSSILTGSMTSMRTAIIDDTGNIIYQFDQLTGAVYDSSGTLIGTIDLTTGVMLDDFGDVIGVLDQTTGRFYNSTGEITGTSQSLSDSIGTMSDNISKSFGSIQESLGDLSGIMDSFSADFQSSLTDMMLHSAAMTAIIAGAQFGPHGLLVGGIIAAVLEIVAYFDEIKDAISGLIKYIQDLLIGFWNWLTGANKEGVDATEDFLESQRELEDQLETMYGQSIGEVIAKDLKVAERAYSDLSSTWKEPLVTRVEPFKRTSTDEHSPEVVSQNIVVYPVINIGSVSSTVDLDQVTDAVNKGIANTFRRRVI